MHPTVNGPLITNSPQILISAADVSSYYILQKFSHVFMKLPINNNNKK